MHASVVHESESLQSPTSWQQLLTAVWPQLLLVQASVVQTSLSSQSATLKQQFGTGGFSHIPASLQLSNVHRTLSLQSGSCCIPGESQAIACTTDWVGSPSCD